MSDDDLAERAMYEYRRVPTISGSIAAERREFWRAVFLSCPDLHVITASSLADAALAEYDKRFKT